MNRQCPKCRDTVVMNKKNIIRPLQVSKTELHTALKNLVITSLLGFASCLPAYCVMNNFYFIMMQRQQD